MTAIDLAPCWNCRSGVDFRVMGGMNGGGVQVVCKCGATGPYKPSEAEAASAWNAVRYFGRVALVQGREGIPNDTRVVAERLRMLAENVDNGGHGAPDSYLCLLVKKGSPASSVTAVKCFLDATRAEDVLKAVLKSAAVHRQIDVIGGHPSNQPGVPQ